MPLASGLLRRPMGNANRELKIAAFAETDVGLVRENNEDSFLIADLSHGVATQASSTLDHIVGEKGMIFLVADGMGGAEAGEVASQMAVELVSRQLFERTSQSKAPNRQTFARRLKESIQHANGAIHEEWQRNDKLRGMGTTLTAAALFDGALFFAQVGDSRAYLIRQGWIVQMTEDQSLVARLVASGALSAEEAKRHPQRNIILQALGVEKHVNAVLSFAELKRGDWVVLCSDGLSGKIDGEEMRRGVEKWQDPEEVCHQLIAMARERGGEDNITLIVVRFDGQALSPSAAGEMPAYQEYHAGSKRRFWPWRES